MIDAGPDALLEAALSLSVMQRCRRAYLHDMRDGLQAVRLACEVLSRAAVSASVNADSLTMASELVRRALSNHDQLLQQALENLLPGPEAPAPLELEPLVRELLRLLQNEAVSRNVALRFVASGPATVAAHKASLRLVLLSLLINGIDALPIGGELLVTLEQRDSRAMVAIVGLTDARQLEELLLPVARRLLLVDAGQLTLGADGAQRRTVCISLPVLQ